LEDFSVPDPYLATPVLVVTSYKGSPLALTITPKRDGAAIDDLAAYDQIEWSWFTGSRESPGAKALTVKMTGIAPNYITVVSVGGFPSLIIDIPGTATNAVAPGQYYAELLLTPPGGEATLTAWATIQHQPTTIGL
jgi:hypothetical protein